MLKETSKNDPRKNWDTDYIRMNQQVVKKNVEQRIEHNKYRKEKQQDAQQYNELVWRKYRTFQMNKWAYLKYIRTQALENKRKQMQTCESIKKLFCIRILLRIWAVLCHKIEVFRIKQTKFLAIMRI